MLQWGVGGVGGHSRSAHPRHPWHQIPNVRICSSWLEYSVSVVVDGTYLTPSTVTVRL